MSMRIDQLARYNASHPVVPSAEKLMEIAWQQDIAEVTRAEVRLDDAFVWERDYHDVYRGKVIYPDNLPFVRYVLGLTKE